MLATRRVRWLVLIVAALLAGYWVLLRWVPVPGIGMPGRDVPFMDKNLNLAAWLDRGAMAWTQRWLHTGTLYNHTRDPEGLLSTLPAVATTLLGSLAGLTMQAASAGRASWTSVRARLAAWGVAGIVAGEVWSLWFPINKNLWTSSYVLLAAGLAALVLAASSWLVDDRPQPWPTWLRVLTWPWLVFGSNAIAAFTISIVIVKTMLYLHATGADGVRRTWWYFAYWDVFARRDRMRGRRWRLPCASLRCASCRCGSCGERKSSCGFERCGAWVVARWAGWNGYGKGCLRSTWCSRCC